MSPEANAIARHRIERADVACREGDLLAQQRSHSGAANRYYYAAFYAACRQLLQASES